MIAAAHGALLVLTMLSGSHISSSGAIELQLRQSGWRSAGGCAQARIQESEGLNRGDTKSRFSPVAECILVARNTDDIEPYVFAGDAFEIDCEAVTSGKRDGLIWKDRAHAFFIFAQRRPFDLVVIWQRPFQQSNVESEPKAQRGRPASIQGANIDVDYWSIVRNGSEGDSLRCHSDVRPRLRLDDSKLAFSGSPQFVRRAPQSIRINSESAGKYSQQSVGDLNFGNEFSEPLKKCVAFFLSLGNGMLLMWFGARLVSNGDSVSGWRRRCLHIVGWGLALLGPWCGLIGLAWFGLLRSSP